MRMSKGNARIADVSCIARKNMLSEALVQTAKAGYIRREHGLHQMGYSAGAVIPVFD